MPDTETEDEVPESILRMQRMMKAGVLAPGAIITYSVKANNKTLDFQAELGADGTLGKAKEVTPPADATSKPDAPPDAMDVDTPPKGAPPPARPDDEAPVFSSPTSFASAMYKRAASQMNPRNKRKPSINGWTDCTVNGKTLMDLRAIMLRERKAASSSATAPAPKLPQKRLPSPSPAVEKAVQEKPDEDMGEKKPASSSGKPEKASDKAPEKASEKALETIPVKVPAKVPEKAPEKAPNKPAEKTSESAPEKASEMESNSAPAKAVEKTKSAAEESTKDSNKVSGQESKLKPLPGRPAKSDTKENLPSEPGKTEVDKPSGAEPQKEKDPKPKHKSPSPERDPTPAPKREEKGSGNKEEEAPKKSSKSKKGSSKKSPSPAPEGKKRKRPESTNHISGSHSGSASGERQGRSRSSKSRRRLNAEVIPTENLDPDTVEAVAVAAAAEKEEAIAARRTTRLAARKIDRVDYNASNAMPKPSGNADHDDSDGDHVRREQSVDEPRKSRRREGHERERQRSSRRQAKKRASREQSPGRNGGDETRASKRASRNGSRNGDSDGAKRGSSVGKDDMDIDTGSGSGSPDSDGDYEEGDEFSAVNMADREDEEGWTILCLSEIAKAVHRGGHTSPSAVAADLKKEKQLNNLGLSEKDVVDKMREVIDHIKRFNCRILDTSDYSVRVNDILAFFATDIHRMRSGHPRPVHTAQLRMGRMEKRKVSLEKKKRRVKREFDDAMAKLDNEMDARRKAGVEAQFMAIDLKELERKMERETKSNAYMEKQIRYAAAQERDGRKRVERTKRLYSKLVETAENNDAPKVDLSAAESNAAAASSSKKARQRTASGNTVDSATIGESITSDEPRIGIDGGRKGGDGSRPAAEVESSPPDPRRMAELERMRTLVQVRAAEAAEAQRVCELEALKFRGLMDAKEKLDRDLYMAKGSTHHWMHGRSGGLPPTAPAQRNKESDKRGSKGGSSKQANGGGKGRSGGGKSGGGGGASGSKNGGKKSSRKDDKSRRKGSSSKAGAGSNA